MAASQLRCDRCRSGPSADRAWRTRDQLELAIVEWVGWYNQRRLHSSLGDIPPAEFEALAANHDTAMLRN